MEILGKISSLSGVLGLLVCLMAAFGRFYGERWFFGFQAINVFIIGIALMALASWLKLEAQERS